MIDHITLHVADMGQAREFYTVVLATLGYRCVFEGEDEGIRVMGFSAEGHLDTWFTDEKPVSGPCHLAWNAAERAQVDAFYKAALAAGAQDNGPPGLRDEYHPHYYGAFVIDPDGNNIEAVCHEAP